MEDKFELDRFLLVQVLDYDDVKHQSESDEQTLSFISKI